MAKHYHWVRFPRWLSGKEFACQCRRCKRQVLRFPSLGWEDPLEKEMATHSSILAWEIPWTEEPDGFQCPACVLLSISVRVSSDEISIWISKLNRGDCPLFRALPSVQEIVGEKQLIEGLNRTKSRVKENLFFSW